MVVRPERVRVEAPEDRREPVAGEGRPRRLRRAISQLVVTLDRGTPIRCMLANDGAASSFDRGAPVSVYLPCEALRVLRTEHTGANEEESWEHSAERARTTANQ